MEGQREFAKLANGRVVPGSGAAGGDFSNDVHLRNGWQAEVKRFRTGEKTLYDWLQDEREKPDIVAFRADRMPWVVAMLAPRFVALTAVQMAAMELLDTLDDDFPDPVYFEDFMEAAAGLRKAVMNSTRKELQGKGVHTVVIDEGHNAGG